MTAVTVKIRFVNGDYHEFDGEPELLDSLAELQAQGWEGKQLVDLLLTSDWGPPPVSVDICSTDQAGQAVELRIFYE